MTKRRNTILAKASLTPVSDQSYRQVSLKVVEFEIDFRAFIPSTLHEHWKANGMDPPWFNSPDPFDYFPTMGGESGTVVTKTEYKGDDRGFFVDEDHEKAVTSRLRSYAVVRVGAGQILDVSGFHKIGITHQRVTTTVYDYLGGVVQSEVKINEKRAEEEMNELCGIVAGSGSRIASARFVASVGMPFSPRLAPNIDYDVKFDLKLSDDNAVILELSGRHNEFPAYEAFIRSSAGVQEIWKYDPAEHRQWGPGVVNLNSSRDLAGDDRAKSCRGGRGTGFPKQCYMKSTVLLQQPTTAPASASPSGDH